MSVSEHVPTDDVPVSLTAAESASPDVSVHDDESIVAARKQGVFSTLFPPFSTHPGHLPVEFYFADSNLPYDKYGPRLLFRFLPRLTCPCQDSCGHCTLQIPTTGSLSRQSRHSSV